jgi:hypothetical protein
MIYPQSPTALVSSFAALPSVAAGASGFLTLTGAPAGSVGPVPALGDDALGAEGAGALEDGFTVPGLFRFL